MIGFTLIQGIRELANIVCHSQPHHFTNHDEFGAECYVEAKRVHKTDVEHEETEGHAYPREVHDGICQDVERLRVVCHFGVAEPRQDN